MSSTTTDPAGDVVLVDFPLAVSGPGKPRPALVILDTGDADVVLARVTTRPRATAYDVPLAGWQTAGRLAPSVVRLPKLATLVKTRVRRYLGTLDANDESVGQRSRRPNLHSLINH